MDKFDISILEYLGKLDAGILVLLSIVYNGGYYEATYFYTSDQLVLTVPEELEEVLGHKITEDENYSDLIRQIIKKVVPHKEMYNRIDEVDFNRWEYDIDGEPEELEDIDGEPEELEENIDTKEVATSENPEE